MFPGGACSCGCPAEAELAGEMMKNPYEATPEVLAKGEHVWTDGRIFHVPYRGQGSMPSHVRQLDDDELWAVVHWIRKMQSERPVAPPTEDDLKELKR